MRKEHEQITGEYLDWQLAETARNELDDDEVEMRLLAESNECEERRFLEEIWNITPQVNGCRTSQRPEA